MKNVVLQEQRIVILLLRSYNAQQHTLTHTRAKRNVGKRRGRFSRRRTRGWESKEGIVERNSSSTLDVGSIRDLTHFGIWRIPRDKMPNVVFFFFDDQTKWRIMNFLCL